MADGILAGCPPGAKFRNSPAAVAPGCTGTGLGAMASVAPGNCWIEKITAAGLPAAVGDAVAELVVYAAIGAQR